MSIKLTWRAGNTASAQINIYRGTGTIDPGNLGTPIATLPGNATTYTDETTVLGVAYAYIVEVKSTNNTVRTTPTTQTDLMQRGPGSMVLVRGSSDYGYLGEVSSRDLPDALANLAPFGLAQDVRNMQDWSSTVKWHKFIRKGRIYFVPEIPVTVGMAFLSAIWSLNRVGMASGLNWNFDISDPKYDTYRVKNVVSFGDWKFNVRAPRGFADDWNGVKDGDKGDMNAGEFGQLILPMYRGIAFNNEVGNVCPFYTTFHGRILCAETLPTADQTAAYNPPTVFSSLLNIAYWNSTKINYISQGTEYPDYQASAFLSNSYRPNGPCYWPIMELIEE